MKTTRMLICLGLSAIWSVAGLWLASEGYQDRAHGAVGLALLFLVIAVFAEDDET